MKLVAIVSMLFLSVVTLVVGLRLLRVAQRTRQHPELLFGVAFVTGSLGTALGQFGQRALWTEPGPLATTANTLCFLLMALGSMALYVAVWRIYRPNLAWAKAVMLLGIATTLSAVVIRLASGELAAPVPGTIGLLVYLLSRLALFLWAAFEALRYYSLLRRRLALGLADPVAAGQILLWGVSASAMVLTMALAVFCMGVLQRHPIDMPLSLAVIVCAVLVAAASMWCAFFPPARLRNRILAHTTPV